MGLKWTEAELDKYIQKGGEIDGVLPKREASFEEIVREARNEKIIQSFLEREGIKFRSKTEKRAWEEWVPTTGCSEAYYEPIRVYLNSGSYRPDFVLRMPERQLWFIEVKGSWKAYKSGRSSKKSLKEAARMYWWLGRWFSLLPEKGGGWDLEEMSYV